MSQRRPRLLLLDDWEHRMRNAPAAARLRELADVTVLDRPLAEVPDSELRDVRVVARHEMGHVLGLAHHAAPTSVMAALVSAERIGEGDRAVLRALYALPAGAPCTALPSS